MHFQSPLYFQIHANLDIKERKITGANRKGLTGDTGDESNQIKISPLGSVMPKTGSYKLYGSMIGSNIIRHNFERKYSRPKKLHFWLVMRNTA